MYLFFQYFLFQIIYGHLRSKEIYTRVRTSVSRDDYGISKTHVYKSKQVMEQVFLDMTNVSSVVKVE